jgi:16S rRNA (guanine966-N2)-methyltransferase
MRIIAGRHKGAKLLSPEGKWLRPTADRTRETIFSFLQEAIVDASVLDLFAGTGSMGIEALSRGAKQVTFVDNSINAIRLIQKNLDKLQLAGEIYRMTEFKFLKKAIQNSFSYNIIFCDPPYEYNNFENLMKQIYDAHVVCSNGFLIYESAVKSTHPDVEFFNLIKEKRQGDTKMTFYKSRI